jgi:hypothetical protein
VAGAIFLLLLDTARNQFEKPKKDETEENRFQVFYYSELKFVNV